MVSFQFHQVINAKSLAKHGNGAHKPFKTRFTKTGHQTLTYKFSKRDFNIKRQILELQLNEVNIKTLSMGVVPSEYNPQNEMPKLPNEFKT